MQKKRATGKNWTVLGTHVFIVLTLLIIIIRIATNKYNDGYLLLFLWSLLTLAPPAIVVSRALKFSYLLFSMSIFLACFLFQPLFWTFGKIGFISFYSYSLFIFIPIECLLLLPFMRSGASSSTNKVSYHKSTNDEVVGNTNSSDQAFADSIAKQAKSLISQNNVNQALNLLISKCNNRLMEKELTVLQQQWTDFEKRRKLGILSEDSSRVVMASVVNGILSIIDLNSPQK